MSLSVTLTALRPTEVYSRNVTHNLAEMAKGADLYMLLWAPDEIDITKASQLIRPLTLGLDRLKADPSRFQGQGFNPLNGWSSYDSLVQFVEGYLAACIKSPDADVSVDR